MKWSVRCSVSSVFVTIAMTRRGRGYRFSSIFPWRTPSMAFVGSMVTIWTIIITVVMPTTVRWSGSRTIVTRWPRQRTHLSILFFHGLHVETLTGIFYFDRNLTTSPDDHWMTTRHYRMFQASRLQWMICDWLVALLRNHCSRYWKEEVEDKRTVYFPVHVPAVCIIIVASVRSMSVEFLCDLLLGWNRNARKQRVIPSKEIRRDREKQSAKQRTLCGSAIDEAFDQSTLYHHLPLWHLESANRTDRDRFAVMVASLTSVSSRYSSNHSNSSLGGWVYLGEKSSGSFLVRLIVVLTECT